MGLGGYCTTKPRAFGLTRIENNTNKVLGWNVVDLVPFDIFIFSINQCTILWELGCCLWL